MGVGWGRKGRATRPPLAPLVTNHVRGAIGSFTNVSGDKWREGVRVDTKCQLGDSVSMRNDRW